MYPEEL